MRVPIYVIVSVVLVGCATKEDQKGALDAWGECVTREVAKVDDVKTDPLTIAYGISPRCASLYNQFSDTMQSGMITEGAQRSMRQNVKDGELRLITSAILNYRASKR